MSSKLYRIYHWDQNDRSEVARAKADDFDKVTEFLLGEFIKPEYRDSVETTEGGLEWSDSDPDTCFKEIVDSELSDTYDAEEWEETQADHTIICEHCDGCSTGLYIEEVENPKAEYGETWDYKTIFGTNEFYDLTGETPIKADDWNPALAAVWKKTPELGGAALVAATVDPDMEKGVDPALLKRGRDALKEAA